MNELATKIARAEIRGRVFKHLNTLHGERYADAYRLVIALVLMQSIWPSMI